MSVEHAEITFEEASGENTVFTELPTFGINSSENDNEPLDLSVPREQRDEVRSSVYPSANQETIRNTVGRSHHDAAMSGYVQDISMPEMFTPMPRYQPTRHSGNTEAGTLEEARYQELNVIGHDFSRLFTEERNLETGGMMHLPFAEQPPNSSQDYPQRICSVSDLQPPGLHDYNTNVSWVTDGRLEHLCQSTAALISDEDPENFVSTYAEMAAFKLLKDSGFTFIKGKSGSGKSKLGLRLMAEMQRLNDRIPVIIASPEQWHLIPKSQHTYINTSTDDEQAKKKYIVMIDDIFGSSNLVQSQVDEWTRTFDIMWPSVESGDIFLVITSRPEICSKCEHKIKKHKLFKGLTSLVLDQGRYALRHFEKQRILRTLCGKKVSFTNDDVKLIAGLDTALGFPQCCKYFSASRQAQRRGIKFFQNPNEYVLEEVYKTMENDGLGYLILLLVMMRKGCLDTKDLDPFSCSTDILTMIEDLRQLCVQIPTHPTLKDIRNKADSFCGSFLNVSQGQYEFQHQSVHDAVFVSISKDHPEICLCQCPVHIIMELVRTKSLETERNDMIIYLTRDHYKTFAKRITELLLSEEYYVRVGFSSQLEEYNTVHETNDISNNSDIVNHQCFSDNAFLLYIVDMWETENKISELLERTYFYKNARDQRDPTMTSFLSDTLLFEVRNFLAYMIFKKNSATAL